MQVDLGACSKFNMRVCHCALRVGRRDRCVASPDTGQRERYVARESVNAVGCLVMHRPAGKRAAPAIHRNVIPCCVPSPARRCSLLRACRSSWMLRLRRPPGYPLNRPLLRLQLSRPLQRRLRLLPQRQPMHRSPRCRRSSSPRNAGLKRSPVRSRRPRCSISRISPTRPPPTCPASCNSHRARKFHAQAARDRRRASICAVRRRRKCCC